MSKQPSGKVKQPERRKRRRFTDEFKAEAVQMLLDGHSAGSINARLGLSSSNVLYRWKRDALKFFVRNFSAFCGEVLVRLLNCLRGSCCGPVAAIQLQGVALIVM
jgi:hypothetical protein